MAMVIINMYPYAKGGRSFESGDTNEAGSFWVLYFLYSLAMDQNNRYPYRLKLEIIHLGGLNFEPNQIKTKPLNWPFCFAEACLTQEGGSD